jgi:GTP-binding protein EngB required for normal cell division
MTTISPVDYSFHDLEKINEDPIIVTVAGHANHGKTSIIRTFTRDNKFGAVSDVPGATKDIHYTKFILHGKTYLKLHDTPGFQFSSLAIETCGETCVIEDIENFFQSSDEFRHDLLALEQVRKSHIILYVVDVTQPPSERLRDDFQVLAKSMVPVLPLFNFTSNKSANYEREWKEALRRYNYHDFTRYDAHHFNPAHEQLLYQRMVDKLQDQTLQRKFLEWRMRDSRRQEQDLARRGRLVICEMLLDSVAYRESATHVTKENRKDVEQIVLDTFRKRIQEREYQAFEQLLEIYSIDRNRLHNQGDPGEATPIWSRDPFGPQSKRDFGVGVSGGMASGAITGGAIDVMVGGATFMTGTVIGAVVGGVAGLFGGALFNRQYDAETGVVAIQAEPNIWRMLAGRAVALFNDVRYCGAASETEFKVSTKPPEFSKKQWNQLLAILSEVSHTPELSRIGKNSTQFAALPEKHRRLREQKLAELDNWVIGVSEDLKTEQ